VLQRLTHTGNGYGITLNYVDNVRIKNAMMNILNFSRFSFKSLGSKNLSILDSNFQSNNYAIAAEILLSDEIKIINCSFIGDMYLFYREIAPNTA
jgi:hypothetical protein